MSKENKDIYEKLINLGAEKLAQILIKLSEENDTVKNHIKSLTATSEENVKTFRKTLSKIKNRKRFIEWNNTRDFSIELENLLKTLETGVQEPVIGIELITEFFEADSKILEICDDSSGIVGDVFTYDAKILFENYALKCTDKEWIIQQVLKLYKNNDYGVRDCIIKDVKHFLPVESIQTLVDLFFKEASNSSDGFYEKKRWFVGIKILAKQLNSPELFKKAELSIQPELTLNAILELSEIYLESGEPSKALSYLLETPDINISFEYKKNELLLAIYNKLGNKEKEVEIALKIFRKNRTDNNFETLVKILDKSEKEALLNEELALIIQEKTFSATDVNFMIFTGFTQEAENYILERKEQLNGAYYGSILPIAEKLEKSELYLSASIIYRELLDSILRRATSKYYPYGAKYLKKLDNMELKISEWKEILPHNEYFINLKQEHKKKYAFWSQYK